MTIFGHTIPIPIGRSLIILCSSLFVFSSPISFEYANMSFNQAGRRDDAKAKWTMIDMLDIHCAFPYLAMETRCSERRPSNPGAVPFRRFLIIFQSFYGVDSTGNTSRNNVPNKTLLVGTFLFSVLGTLRSRFCVPETVLDVPDIIWNILPNNIWNIFLISDL